MYGTVRNCQLPHCQWLLKCVRHTLFPLVICMVARKKIKDGKYNSAELFFRELNLAFRKIENLAKVKFRSHFSEQNSKKTTTYRYYCTLTYLGRWSRCRGRWPASSWLGIWRCAGCSGSRTWPSSHRSPAGSPAQARAQMLKGQSCSSQGTDVKGVVLLKPGHRLKGVILLKPG